MSSAKSPLPERPGYSLAAQLSVTLAAVLLIVSLGAGIAVYATVRHSLNTSLHRRLQEVLVALQAVVHLDGNQLDFETVRSDIFRRENWRVTTETGQVLWVSPGWEKREGASETRKITVTPGDPRLPVALLPLIKDKLSTSGVVPHDTYRIPGGQRPVLILEASVSRVHVDDSLRKLLFGLWTGGALLVTITAAALTWLIHWRLAPLKEMARQASSITPEQMAPITGIGGGAECVGLRNTLNMMLARLEEGLGRERRFSANTAHEMRTPLANLRTGIEVALRRERPSAEYRQTLSELLSDIDRLQKLTTGLLELTRANEAGIDKTSPAPLTKLVAQAWKDAGFSPDTCPKQIPDITIRCAPELMTSALRNVYENARRYAPGADPVTGVLNNDGTALTLYIRDSGPGVPVEARERIFQPFTRLNEARTISAAPGGFGIGLAIAREVLRSQGGDLVCVGRGDGQQGAEFQFQFNLREDRPSSRITAQK